MMLTTNNYEGNGDAMKKEKKEETKVLLRQIEERIGMSLDELMGA